VKLARDEHHSQLEQLSPELVLVDPELASDAREHLPDPGEIGRRRAEPPQGKVSAQAASVAATEAPSAGHSDDAALTPQPPVRDARLPPKRRRSLVEVRRSAVLLALCILIVGGVVALKRAMPGKQRAAPTTQGAGTSRPTKGSGAVAPVGSVAPRGQSSSGQVTSTGRRLGLRTRKLKSAGVAGIRATSRGRRPRTRPLSPPVIVWHSVPRARFYWFQLNRVDLPGTRKILDAFPIRPRIALHPTWVNAAHRYRLTSGRYWWSVWPEFGPRDEPRYTKLGARGTFVIRQTPWLEKR
jgi:hypothetical protein